MPAAEASICSEASADKYRHTLLDIIKQYNNQAFGYTSGHWSDKKANDIKSSVHTRKRSSHLNLVFHDDEGCASYHRHITMKAGLLTGKIYHNQLLI